jgi:hypothetical protein
MMGRCNRGYREYACNASYYISEFDFENAEKQFDQC